jgi:4-amino-4-deoxy-L-arabinose transferase-like glycosyltransferase
MGLAFLTRTAGASLIVGFALFYLVRCFQRRRPSSHALLAIVLAVLVSTTWYYYSWRSTGETSLSVYRAYAFRTDMYGPAASDGAIASGLHRLRENSLGYLFIFAFPDASLRFRNAPRTSAAGIVSVLIALCALVGFVRQLRRGGNVGDWYVVAQSS